MQIIHELAGGIAGAALGTAAIYRRGTTARAALYTSFEGAIGSSDDVVLDSYGRAVVYVNELVDVVVKDSDGNTVVDFTLGDAAPNEEVRSLSFTGTDYNTAQQLPGNPTTAQAIFDAVKTSFGATDWNVLVNGVATQLQVAIAAVAGIFFNVKSPAYGAVGTGVVDDTAAIQAAINAASSSKGIVFFPAGIYRITSALTVPVDVSLWGVGPGASFIEIDHATANTLTYGSGTSQGYQEIRGLQLLAFQTNSGTTISVTNAGTRRIAIINCRVNFVLNTGKAINVSGDNHRILIDQSELRVNATSVNCVDNNGDNSQSQYEMRNSTLISLVAAYNGYLVSAVNLTATNCTFDMSASTSGTGSCVNIDGNTGKVPHHSVVGCTFWPTTTGTNSTAFILNAFATGLSGTTIAESANTFRPGFSRIYFGLTQTAVNPRMSLASREFIEVAATDNSATLDVLASEEGLYALTRSSAGAQTITSSAIPPAGSRFTFTVLNSTGGAITINFGTGFVSATPSITALANAKLATYEFRSVYLAGGIALVPVAAYTTVL